MWPFTIEAETCEALIEAARQSVEAAVIWAGRGQGLAAGLTVGVVFSWFVYSWGRKWRDRALGLEYRLNPPGFHGLDRGKR